ncbi:TonB-dependent receptor [Alcanivorax sp. S71-1-4]|uniref:TonB-dependent receptor domain-containing protein n=1 Tax=Alcanivorax sp. S71-1-4 TaxID=1177159 RepID=UPI00135C897F|nr:TonB-dependent receptor [Alcanivorax sp. S71-1-4]KAF0810298.1 TonB-dependent receptor [Alcanivorax sp. S71-1-4]
MRALRTRPARCLLATAIAGLSAGALAQESTARLDTIDVVSTAAGYEQKITDAPASITVISREDLERKRFGNLAEALADVEGIDVRGNTGKTGGLNISIRGMPSDYTLILIDGRRQNTAGNVTPNGFGEAATGFMPPLSAIERIEVVRGPMSTLYGSDAMGGVVNIITRKVNETWGGSLTHDYTIQEEREFGDTTNTTLYTSGPLIPDQLGLTVRGSVFNRAESDLKPTGDADSNVELNTRGQNPVEGRIHTFGARLDMISLEDHDIWFDVDVAKQLYDNGTPDDRKLSSNDTPTNWRGYDDELRFNRKQVALGHTSDTAIGRIESSLMRNYTETVGRTIPGNPQNPTNTGIPGKNVGDPRELETTNVVADTKLMTGLGDSHFLTVGAQWWKAEMTDGVATTDFEQTTWALFAEDEWRILDDLALTLGARHDQHDAFGGHTSPRAYAVWNTTDHWTVKGGVSAGYKTPRVDQLHDGIVGFGAQGASASIGSPDLEPETSVSQEIGVYYLGYNGLNLNATIFHNEFDDKIASGPDLLNCSFAADPNRPGCVDYGNFPNQDTFGQSINIDEATTQGLELAATLPLADRWSLSMNYTYTDSEVKENGQSNGKLADTPRHMAHARLNWRTTERLNMWLRADYRGESRRFDGRTSDLTGQDLALYNAVGDLKAYQLFSLGGSLQVNDNLTFSATIENLLNTDFRKFKAYDYNGTTYYASEYSHFSRSTKGAVLEGRRLWLSANVTF